MDTKELRKLYREELQETLATVGGKSRKRTFTRMVRAVFEHRGGELIGPDETVLVWSDLHLTLFRWNLTVFDRTIPSTDCLG